MSESDPMDAQANLPGILESSSGWNPRYLLYVRAMGESDPEQTCERDRQRWPGGKNTGYILWIGDRWATFRAIKGWHHTHPTTDADHAEFTSWLADNLGAPPKAGT